ncbi:hypothetical protein [Pontibacter chitinilyticus]|uniref:hypothetical protein n=1 Tax=Pontibacter chitinilyticus TaxID=2674989 RepID=UPI003219BAF8
MKLRISFFLLLVISLPLLGQNKKESFWKNYIDEDVSELNLQNLENSDYTTAIRLWKPYQVVEFIKVNDSVYQGQLVNFVTKLNRKEEKKAVVSEKVIIPASVTKILIEQLQKEGVEELPDSYDVEGYVNGLDGTTYVFEVSSRDKYRVYSYWEPENDHYQNSDLREVKSVRNVLSAINKEFDSWKLFTLFRDSLPAGRYQYGGIIMVKTK